MYILSVIAYINVKITVKRIKITELGMIIVFDALNKTLTLNEQRAVRRKNLPIQ